METEATTSSEQEETSTLSWKDRVAHLRRMQDEDGAVPISVVDWEVADDEKAVNLTFKTLHDEQTHTETLDAPAPTNPESAFEKVLDAAGCTLETADELGTGESNTLYAVPTNSEAIPEDTQWSVIESVRNRTSNSTSSETDEGQPVASWMENDSTSPPESAYEAYFISFVLGPIALLINLFALRADSFNSEVTYKQIGSALIWSTFGTFLWFAAITLL